MRGASIGCGFVDPNSPMLARTEKPWRAVRENVVATRAIVAAWRAGREAEANGVDALGTFALVEAAAEAANCGRAIVRQRRR